MDLVFSNLAVLKAHVLGVGLTTSTEFDAVLTAIGKGVAGRLQGFCNRCFGRVVGQVDTFPADRDFWVTSRYPIEAVTSLEILYSGQDWAALNLTDYVVSRLSGAGLVHFGGELGGAMDQARLTYTGGFFVETKEPTDQGYPTSKPSGATSIPDDLVWAWLTQCKEVWNRGDRLGTGLADKADAVGALMGLKLVPEVEEAVRVYRRF